jgi:hypothetical protein
VSRPTHLASITGQKMKSRVVSSSTASSSNGGATFAAYGCSLMTPPQPRKPIDSSSFGRRQSIE